MTYPQAINLAIQAIEAQMQDIAFQANLYDVYGADLPATRNASRKRKRLHSAIEVLRPGLEARVLGRG